MWVFYLTVLPIYMSDETSYFVSLIYLGLITLVINFIADITYAFTSDYFFKNSSDKTKSLINKVSGISLLLIGTLPIRQQVLSDSSLSSLNNSEIAPILPNVADSSAGKNILVALPSAIFSNDSRYLIAIKSFDGFPL